MNKYNVSFRICVLVSVSLMVTAVVTTVDLEGRCTLSNCYPNQITHIGFTSSLTMVLIVIAVPPLFIGMVIGWLEEQKKIKENAK